MNSKLTMPNARKTASCKHMTSNFRPHLRRKDKRALRNEWSCNPNPLGKLIRQSLRQTRSRHFGLSAWQKRAANTKRALHMVASWPLNHAVRSEHGRREWVVGVILFDHFPRAERMNLMAQATATSAPGDSGIGTRRRMGFHNGCPCRVGSLAP